MNWLSLPLSLAWRFSRDRKGKGFLSFISTASTLGIFLGCFSLILILSVMNGFERELKQRLLSVVPHAELIAASNNMITDWQQQVDILSQHPQVTAAAPLIKLTAMAQKGKQLKALELRGIDPALEAEVSDIAQYTTTEQWQTLQQASNNVLVGQGALDKLNLSVGDSINLLIPQFTSAGMRAPKRFQFTITGSFEVGGQIDYGLAYINLQQAKQLAGMDKGVQGIRLKVADVFSAANVVREVGLQFPHHVYLHHWMITQGHLYKDIQLVRSIIYLVLTLVLAVAGFNIVSTLVMTVHDKQGEIAILKTMGATDIQVLLCFVFQGLLSGCIGLLFGVTGAVVTTAYLSKIFLYLQRLLDTQFLQQDVYFINFLPTQLQLNDILLTIVITLLVSFLATLYPANKALRIEPAKVLGY